MLINELDARKDIVYYSHKVHAQGLVCATDGNLSVKLDDKHILITPSGLRKEDMHLEAPIVIDMEGNTISGRGKPSTEYKIHIEAYRQRPDIGAVIHAHPPKAIAFTIAESCLDTCILPEVVVTMGKLPVAPYAAPSTDKLPASMRDLIKESDAVMLARHGSVTVGACMADAYKMLERLEHNAEILIYSKILGGAKPFSQKELQELQGLRDFYGVKSKSIPCASSALSADAGAAVAAGINTEGTLRLGRKTESYWGNHDDSEVQAPTYRSGPAGDLDSLVEEIVAQVMKQI